VCVRNDALFGGGRGEVGVRELDKGDKCGMALEGGRNEDEGEERATVDAMRVGPKTRSRQRSTVTRATQPHHAFNSLT
jgi:hypothetical protein